MMPVLPLVMPLKTHSSTNTIGLASTAELLQSSEKPVLLLQQQTEVKHSNRTQMQPDHKDFLDSKKPGSQHNLLLSSRIPMGLNFLDIPKKTEKSKFLGQGHSEEEEECGTKQLEHSESERASNF